MKRFFRDNGLSIVLLTLFALSLVGQFLTGHHKFNQDNRLHGQPAVGYVEYLGEGHFISATFENWESEFLQMAIYVVLTMFLFQKGAHDSKKPGAIERVDLIPDSARNKPDSPYPVRRGGWLLKLYSHSLSLTLFLLFAVSFVLHAYGSTQKYNDEQADHNAPPVTMLEHLGSSDFWFESFQNWQSEFLSIAVLIILSIFLRQRYSPESKPVDAPHSETHDD